MSTEKDAQKEAELRRLAEEEILYEAKRAAIRVEIGGTSGWRKPTLPRTNKVFLRNIIRQTLSSNNQDKTKTKRESQK